MKKRMLAFVVVAVLTGLAFVPAAIAAPPVPVSGKWELEDQFIPGKFVGGNQFFTGEGVTVGSGWSGDFRGTSVDYFSSVAHKNGVVNAEVHRLLLGDRTRLPARYHGARDGAGVHHHGSDGDRGLSSLQKAGWLVCMVPENGGSIGTPWPRIRARCIGKNEKVICRRPAGAGGAPLLPPGIKPRRLPALLQVLQPHGRHHAPPLQRQPGPAAGPAPPGALISARRYPLPPHVSRNRGTFVERSRNAAVTPYIQEVQSVLGSRV